jgi:acetyl esterase/lipase
VSAEAQAVIRGPAMAWAPLPSPSLMPANLLYAGGHDLKHPYLSPLFGDFSRGFPPTLLTAGTRDVFLSNAVRMHWRLRAHGVPAELFIQEAAPHGGFSQGPEADALAAEVNRFLNTHWS